ARPPRGRRSRAARARRTGGGNAVELRPHAKPASQRPPPRQSRSDPGTALATSATSAPPSRDLHDLRFEAAPINISRAISATNPEKRTSGHLHADPFARSRYVSTSICAPSARIVPTNFGKLVATQSTSRTRVGPLASRPRTHAVIAIR